MPYSIIWALQQSWLLYLQLATKGIRQDSPFKAKSADKVVRRSVRHAVGVRLFLFPPLSSLMGLVQFLHISQKSFFSFLSFAPLPSALTFYALPGRRYQGFSWTPSSVVVPSRHTDTFALWRHWPVWCDESTCSLRRLLPIPDIFSCLRQYCVDKIHSVFWCRTVEITVSLFSGNR